MKTSKAYTVGFIGLGNMGKAIARGCVSSKYVERSKVLVYDHNDSNMNTAKSEGFSIAAGEKEVAENSHIVFICVHPDQADGVLNEIKDTHPECVLSIITGLSIAHIQEVLGDKTAVIRAMPNTPLQINEGATALCKSSSCTADDYDFVFRMFSAMGTARSIPEEQMNAVITVHGSVPAYVYYFAECVINDAVSRGIDEEAARALLVQTFIGSGKLMKENFTKSVSELIDEVASKGGTTIEAINEFKNQDLQKVVHEANEKCVKRAEELSK